MLATKSLGYELLILSRTFLFFSNLRSGARKKRTPVCRLTFNVSKVLMHLRVGNVA